MERLAAVSAAFSGCYTTGALMMCAAQTVFAADRRTVRSRAAHQASVTRDPFSASSLSTVLVCRTPGDFIERRMIDTMDLETSSNRSPDGTH